jgi:histidinol-phosphate aminotransferase
MSVATRADLAELPDYVPGRSVPGAIKLASNEVPAGPLPSVRQAIAEAAGEANRYPDTAASALRARLAERADVPAGSVVVGCGSVMLCQMLIQATCADGDEVAFAWRSFEAYPILTRVAGARPVAVPLRADQTIDVEAMLAAMSPRTRVVFACTPNNPTGTALSEPELSRLVDGVPPGVLVVLDEAYREFCDDPAIPDGLAFAKRAAGAGRENVVVLRTFSKAYGLAGLRVGYAVAPAPVAAALRKVAVPFSVNTLAQAAAIASLDVEDELMARCRAIVAERRRVSEALLAAGYAVPDSQANFVWLPLGARTAALAEHCAERKVIVRPFDGDGARVTIGEPEENDAFLAAARSFVAA